MILKTLTPAIVFMLISLVSLIGLTLMQKGNRKFERKGVMLYLFITLLLFLVLGLVGLLTYEKGLTWTVSLSQAIMLLFGLFHAWFLFANFDWADRASFWPESILTLALTATAGLGFISGLWGWDKLLAESRGHSLPAYTAVLCLPLPYLLSRTYDFIRQIPRRRYIAWQYPSVPPRKLNLSDSNVIYVYMTLYTDEERRPESKIADRRCRMPKDAPFGTFFQTFVDDYNALTSKDGYPIGNLQKDSTGQDIGWLFYVRQTARGQRALIDPFATTTTQIREGNFIFARRVPLGSAYRPSSPSFYEPVLRFSDDNDITITEK